MSENLLSACMIVRNEEEHIGGALLSLKSFVDEIVVVDTGSTDGTPGICSDYGVRLFHFPWKDNFSSARNEALNRARGKWILSIDADERLRPSSKASLETILNDESKIALHALLYPETGWTGVRVLRLFRNDPRIRYLGFIHESVGSGIRRVQASEEKSIGESGLEFDHLGYDTDQTHKHRRNLPLLLKELERDPDNTNNLRHLALVYSNLGDDSLAESTWRAAIEAIRLKIERQPIDCVPYIDLIKRRTARSEPCSDLLSEAMALFPENPCLYLFKGRELMDLGRFKEAIAFFERLIEWGKRRDFDRSISYDRNTFDLYAYDSLATCFFRLGCYSEGRRYFEIAQHYAPNQFEYKIKARLCCALDEDRSLSPFNN